MDASEERGRFLLTGSQGLELMKGASGMGAILCLCEHRAYLRENLLALPP